MHFLHKFIKNENGSSSVEAAIVLIPIMLLVFIFIIYFNKTSLETETSYAMKESIRSAVTQGTYAEAKAKAIGTFNDVLALNSDDTKLRTENLNGTENIYFKLYDLDGNVVSGEDNWCRDYTLEMTVKVEKKSPIIVQNTLLNEFGAPGDNTRRTINNTMMLDKQISTKIENAKVCH